ncbi:MAG: Asparaginyl-tRNA synthetase [Candidatus Saccharicenans subterraneus]|uniref:Asparagine--tRNA ligase n=1 Tax=Candidatus Saccharicenans subterraneus TaxID=2508984 RepID=A0A3E2BMU0_9BACT|nr:MAG: Asparaginyl-tRNA synthetase [Candidatus Saccharicenans subterraneum]
MKWVYIEDISQHNGQEVEIRGWVYNKRSSGKVRFLLVRDGTGIIQGTVFHPDKDFPLFKVFDDLTQESSVIVRGKVREDRRAPGGYELEISDIEVIQIARDYPITPKEHSVPFLMEHRHLWLRSQKQHAILQVRAETVRAIRDFFDGRGFRLMDTPILTPSACEGTTTLFETQYFDQKAYLSQSGQLYNEATAAAFGKVYCFGPTFRAEKSKTRRHLIEFWMVEPEVAFATLEDIIELGQDLILFILERVLERRKRDLEVLERDTAPLERITKPFPRLTYDEAVKQLVEHGSKMVYGDDFGAPEETILSQIYDRPVCVTHFPAKIKAFYMQPDPQRPDLALGVDFMASEGYGEIIGGGQRIHDLELLERRIKEFNLPEEAYKWYVDLRRYGTFPHSGFGLGLERTVAWICKLPHIRETIPFPRLLYRIYP